MIYVCMYEYLDWPKFGGTVLRKESESKTGSERESDPVFCTSLQKSSSTDVQLGNHSQFRSKFCGPQTKFPKILIFSPIASLEFSGSALTDFSLLEQHLHSHHFPRSQLIARHLPMAISHQHLKLEDPFLQNYKPSELRIASEFLTTWLPFLSRDLCQDCTQLLSDRIRALDPGILLLLSIVLDELFHLKF